MSVEVVSARYAGALCDTFDDESLDDLLEVMRFLQEAFEPSMDQVFTNPNVSQEERIKLIDQVFEGQNLERLKRFCKLLIRKERFQYFSDIVEACETEVNNRLGRKPATVESAFELDDPQVDMLKDQLGNVFEADIVIDETNAPELLAGLRVKIDDYLMEHTVSNQLEQLRSKYS